MLYTDNISKLINYALYEMKDILSDKLDDIVLNEYQMFTSKIFLKLQSLRKLLLFWDTGSGKTLVTVFILKNLRLLYPNWKIILLIKASLKEDPWENTLNKYAKELDVIFVHYDDTKAYLNLQTTLKRIDIKNFRIIFIIDECHNFISRSLEINNIKKKGKKLYNLVKEYTDPKTIKGVNNRLILISATPIINNIAEFNLLIALLRNDKIKIFSNHFNNDILLVKDYLINYLAGSISYYRFNEIDSLDNMNLSEKYPEKKITYHSIKMTDYQSELYNKAYKYEIKTNNTKFRILRRLASTFVYTQSKYNVDKEEQSLLVGEQFNEFINEFKNFKFSSYFKAYFKNNKTIEYFSQNPDTQKNKESIKFNKLYNYSCKYIEACKIILNSKGKVLIYEPFVLFEGISTLKIYLEIFGFTFIEYSKNTIKTRVKDVERFNEISNIDGDKIKVCIFSKAGFEGLNFIGINDLILMDIPWSDANLRQIIGRGIRLNSHIMLDIERRYINIHILKAYTKENKSVDDEMLQVLTRKHEKISELYDALKLASLEYCRIRNSNIFVEEENITYIRNLELDNPKEFYIENHFEKKFLTDIKYTFDKNIIYDGLLDKDTLIIYDSKTCKKIGTIIDVMKFIVVNKEIVYII